MLEYYPQIKHVHIASVVCSGLLFACRGLLVQIGRKGFAQAVAVRYLSYSIDSVLLISAVSLVAILPQAMFANGWLFSKLILVVFYVIMGSVALKRGNTVRVRRVCYVIALLTFVTIIGIAYAHNPLGWLHIWRN